MEEPPSTHVVAINSLRKDASTSSSAKTSVLSLNKGYQNSKQEDLET